MILIGKGVNNMFVFEKTNKIIDMHDVSFSDLHQEEQVLPYVIKRQADNEIIGYLFVDEPTSNNVLRIGFIEIVNTLQCQGLGKQVVRAIFSAFSVSSIEGIALYGDDTCAYSFWSSLGAEMEKHTGYPFEEVPFVLTLPVESYLQGVIIEQSFA